MNINRQFDEYGFTCFSSSSTWSQLVPRQPFLRSTSVKKGKTNIFSLVSGNKYCCCWILVHVSTKYIFPDIWPADTNKLSDLQIHVPDTQKPCPEQFGSWQSTAKKKEIFTVVQEKTSFSSTIFFFFLFTIRVWRYSLDDEKLQPSKKVKPSDFSLVKIGSWEMLEKCFVEWEQ